MRAIVIPLDKDGLHRGSGWNLKPPHYDALVQFLDAVKLNDSDIDGFKIEITKIGEGE